MKVKSMIVISALDLEEEIENQYNVRVDVAPLFWPEDFMNDCYKSLWISEEAVQEDDYGSEEEISQRTLIRRHLQDIFPGQEEILVDVSW